MRSNRPQCGVRTVRAAHEAKQTGEVERGDDTLAYSHWVGLFKASAIIDPRIGSRIAFPLDSDSMIQVGKYSVYRLRFLNSFFVCVRIRCSWYNRVLLAMYLKFVWLLNESDLFYRLEFEQNEQHDSDDLQERGEFFL